MPRTGAREEGGGHRNHHGGQASSWLTNNIIVMLETFTLHGVETPTASLASKLIIHTACQRGTTAE
jgi:hypothetical protein